MIPLSRLRILQMFMKMTNVQLKRLIKKIEVDKDGNVDIYLRFTR